MASQELPGKDAALFRTLVKLYESKQYKKGIKTADQILKKYSEHGETLAMKGLLLNSLGKREEAYEYTRNGLKANLKSHVCWHVYGLIYRGDSNYDEAIKCYKNALRIERDNLTILRDLALLQVQMRDTAGFLETRQQILKLKPEVLGAYEQIQEEVAPGEAYEHSEMLLYKAQLLEASEQYEAALAHMKSHEDDIVDKLGTREMRARIFLKMQRFEESEQLYRELLAITPDNYRYHEGLRASMQVPVDSCAPLTGDQRSRLQSLYAELAETFPRSAAVRRIPLDFLEGQDFESAAETHAQHFLRREIPSLFSDIKPLYRDAAKQETLQLLLERLHSSAQASSRAAADSGTTTDTTNSSESYDAAVWTKLYLAQHYDHLGNTKRAVELLNEAIQLAPDLIELHTAMAKVLKHAGDAQGAAQAAVKAQSLDLADRYLNSTAAKYLFRADRVSEATRMAARFTKDGEQANNLYDMQCTWYEIECGSAHLRLHELGQALKKFLAVHKHFEDFREDQFDFHSYCTRKMTLRSYMQMLEMQDNLYHNLAYSKAAWGAIDAYLQLHASLHRSDSKDTNSADSSAGKLTPGERKKQKQRQRKEAQKQKKQDEEQKAKEDSKAQQQQAQQQQKVPAAKRDQDPDPLGKELASTSDPLGEAVKLVCMLRDNAGDRMRTHEEAFEVYLLRGKLLLALQAVKRALALSGSSHHAPHLMTVRLCQLIQGSSADKLQTNPLVWQIIKEQIDELLGGSSLEQHCARASTASGLCHCAQGPLAASICS
ncbi:hypothetical protein WJX73_004343 [Symbiochloris irregularis]|uniref:Uncharacterized protein n=1 Tax=Symbiochloris irregularis TaxID=706552 RepID=A0AAW1PIY3_9CHLO